MNPEPKPKRGRGQGRKTVDGATDLAPITIQLPPRHRAVVKANGGSAWVRWLINGYLVDKALREGTVKEYDDPF